MKSARAVAEKAAEEGMRALMLSWPKSFRKPLADVIAAALLARDAEMKEACAKVIEERLQNRADGRACNCERCDENMQAADRIRSLPVTP